MPANHAATKWKDGSRGQHVKYDQRPDIFRLTSCRLLGQFYICMHTTLGISNFGIHMSL